MKRHLLAGFLSVFSGLSAQVLAAASAKAAEASETSVTSEPVGHIGIEYEQQSYLRTGVIGEVRIMDHTYVGLGAGLQNAVAADAQGAFHGRPAADAEISLRGQGALLPHLQCRLGLALGIQDYRDASATETKRFGFLDVYSGLSVEYGRIHVYTDLALRNGGYGTDKTVVLGDKRIEHSYLYPRLGVSWSL